MASLNVVFEGVSESDAAALYKFRAEQLLKQPPGSQGSNSEDDRFEEAIRWCVERNAKLTAGFLLWLSETPGQWCRFADYCDEKGVKPPQLRGSFGSFSKNAKKLGYGSGNAWIFDFRQDANDQSYSYRLTDGQAEAIRKILGSFVEGK